MNTSTGDSPSELVERERALLVEVSAPFVRDVVGSLDAAFALTFEVDDTVWMCVCTEEGGVVSGVAICEVGEVESFIGTDSERALCTLASKLADFAFDDVWEPWPRCPDHGEHPLHPDLRDGLAVWACRHPGGGAKARIGELPLNG